MDPLSAVFEEDPFLFAWLPFEQITPPPTRTFGVAIFLSGPRKHLVASDSERGLLHLCAMPLSIHHRIGFLTRFSSNPSGPPPPSEPTLPSYHKKWRPIGFEIHDLCFFLSHTTLWRGVVCGALPCLPKNTPHFLPGIHRLPRICNPPPLEWPIRLVNE